MSLSTLLHRWSEADAQETISIALLLGVFVHQIIRPVELDGKTAKVVGLFALTNATLLSCYAGFTDFSIPNAIGRTALINTTFLIGLFGSITVYRVFFHPLRNFPGPFWAKVTRFHGTHLALKNYQLNVEIQKLHQQYGDFVRIGPREISINRPSAIAMLYGPPTKLRKGPFYAQKSEDSSLVSLNSVRDVEEHQLRRRAWDRAFSVKSLSTYEPRVATITERLASRIKAQNQNPIDVSELSSFYAFDVMGEIGLGKDFYMLDSGKEHPAVAALHEQMLAIGVLQMIPWVLNLLVNIPGIGGSFVKFIKYCHEQLGEKKKAMETCDKEPQDVISWLIKAKCEDDKSAAPTEEALGEDTRLLVIAGSDTTASALTNTFYCFAKYSSIYRSLQKELDTAFPCGISDWTYEKARSIPFLDHVINESMRMRPPVPANLQRLTPLEGLTIDGVYIPGDTIVSVPTYTLQNDARYFEKPDECSPERWENMSAEKTAAFMPFSKGAYGCVGKQLAMMELRMVVARVGLEFDVSFAPGEMGMEFDKGIRDTFTLTLPPLRLAFKERRTVSRT